MTRLRCLIPYMKFDVWIVAVLTLGVVCLGGLDLSGQQQKVEPVALRLDCHGFGPTQRGIFRFTIANNGPEYTNVVAGMLLSGHSWTPVVRLSVRGSGKESDGTYGAGTLGPLRRAAGFAGRADDIVVRLPSGTAYVIELRADLFGRVEPRGKSAPALPVPSEISAIFEGRPISVINTGNEDLRLLNVWTGSVESSSIRVPADCTP
jgi:hypothetical protein